MASNSKFVAYILDQLSKVGDITAKKMFGEYALYSEGKVVGLVCDNHLFIKATLPGRDFIGESNLQEAPPYPGAKPSFLITEQLEDHVWLTQLVQITKNALPLPKPKNKRI